MIRVDLSGRVAFVTGAGQGIGKGIALGLARNGAMVVLADIADLIFDVAKEIEALGSKTLPLKCDVSSKSSVDEAVRKTLEQFGRFDILVNNAGIYPFKMFVEMTEQDWQRVLNINLNGVFYCTKAVLPKMIEQKYGKIVNIASLAGTFLGFQSLVHYSASKAGVVGLTRSLALEVAKLGINVNAIAPGAVETPTTKKVSEATAGRTTQQASQSTVPYPIPRWGTPEDIANLVLYLVSDESSYVTGQCIVIDGGMTLE